MQQAEQRHEQQHVRGRPFPKGTSGNPEGKSKAAREGGAQGRAYGRVVRGAWRVGRFDSGRAHAARAGLWDAAALCG